MNNINKTQKSKGTWLVKNKRYFPLYIMALPAIILMLLYSYLPMTGLYLAFTDFSAGMKLSNVEFVGLKWFEQIFSNEEFIQVMYNTLKISLLKLIFGFPAPIILALLLNEMMGMKFKRTVQTILYLPHFLSWTILAGILFVIFSAQSGIVSIFGIEESIFLNENAFVPLVVISDIWKSAGWGTIVYLSAISSVSTEYYEAAMIDGANRFQRMIKITLPCISSTIIVLLIMKLGQILSAGFDQIFMLSNPAVIDVADILDTYVYRMGMAQGRFGLATAAGLFKSVICLILVLVTNKIVKCFDKEQSVF